jgi:hypothetical protein
MPARQPVTQQRIGDQRPSALPAADRVTTNHRPGSVTAVIRAFGLLDSPADVHGETGGSKLARDLLADALVGTGDQCN